MANVTIVKSNKVYLCCGKYFATTKKAEKEKVVCPYCKKELVAPVRTPVVMICDK